MALSCTTIPTLTRTTAVTTQSTSTIVSSSVTTSPPSTTFMTSIGTTCPSATEEYTTCQTTTRVTNSTIPGATSTVGITQTTVVPITSSVVNTLYSTSCAVVSTSSTNTVTTSTSSRLPYTPSLTTMTSMSSSTAVNGSVIMTQVTETLTYLPSTSSTSAASGINDTSSTSLNLAPIIGGSVGGFFGLSAIVLLGWFLWKRKQNRDNLFAGDAILHDAFPKPKRDPTLDAKPKPYQYGIVGHSAVPPHMSPPPSTGLNLSSEGSNVHPSSHNPPPSQQQAAMQQAQQSVAQQQQQQQSIAQQSQNLVGQQQQSVGSNPGQQTVMQQQQQAMGPSTGQQPLHQQTYGVPSSSSLYNRAIPAALGASLSPRPSAIPVASLASLSPRPSAISSVQDGSSSSSTISAPGPWVSPGSGRYPPGMQRDLSATAGVQAASHAGAALGTGERQSVIDENEVYGGIAMDTPAAGSSGAVNVPLHGYSHSPGMGSGAGPGQDFSEFNPYHEVQQPAREQRDGKGRLVKVTEKPPVVHLDGGRYGLPPLSPGPASVGNESVMAPPAYSA